MHKMNIATQNRLAHLQVEYQEVTEQTQMLQAQLPALTSQLGTLEQYLSYNNGDRKARADYSKTLQRYNSICNTIRRNNLRIQALSRQIAIENQKIMNAQARALMTANQVKGRSRYNYNRYMY